MTSSTSVLFKRDGPIATITLNRPSRRNAIDAEMSAALRAAVSELEADDDLLIGILRGAGPAFSAGMDLAAFERGEAEDILFGPGHLGGFVSRPRRKPVIASVHGPALAGGFELVLACDLVVAAEEAVFGLPEAKIGLVAGAGGALRLGQRLPQAIANELLLTGGTIDAHRAASLGLVNRVVPAGELEDTARGLARVIASNAPLAIEAGLALTAASRNVGSDAIWQENDRHLRALLSSDDAAEGARAFAEKRAPVWRGR
ncbi:MAG: crotonase/enoyl-CoA hydratase family protein [Pseudomonadota bacterium]